MPSNHFLLCRPAPLLLPSIFPSIRVSFPMSWLFASGGQSIGVSASASVLPINIQNWFPLGLTGLISLLSKGLARVFSNTKIQKLSILQHSVFFMIQLSHSYMTTGKTIALTSTQQYWSRLPCPPPGDLPNPRINSHLLHLLHWHVCVLSHFSCVLLSVTTWTVHQAPLSTGFSRQEYWSEPRDWTHVS